VRRRSPDIYNTSKSLVAGRRSPTRVAFERDLAVGHITVRTKRPTQQTAWRALLGSSFDGPAQLHLLSTPDTHERKGRYLRSVDGKSSSVCILAICTSESKKAFRSIPKAKNPFGKVG
jgi:hypothetical protein